MREDSWCESNGVTKTDKGSASLDSVQGWGVRDAAGCACDLNRGRTRNRQSLSVVRGDEDAQPDGKKWVVEVEMRKRSVCREV